MNLLIDGKAIIVYASKIEFGVYDETFEKWALYDNEGNIICYVIDRNYEVVENVELPTDFTDGKYFYENGEFVLNTEWKPYIPPEERIAILEEENARLTNENLDSMEIEAELLYELSALQLGL